MSESIKYKFMDIWVTGSIKDNARVAYAKRIIKWNKSKEV